MKKNSKKAIRHQDEFASRDNAVQAELEIERAEQNARHNIKAQTEDQSQATSTEH